MTPQDLELLSRTPLFAGTTTQQIEAMMGCLGSRTRSYQKDERIYHAGQTVTALGLVLDGSVRVESTDVWGNLSVIGQMGRGQTFADAYAAMRDEPLLVSVTATEPTRVLFLEASRIATSCPRACPWHNAVNQNLIRILAHKNLALSRRIRDAAPKSIRGKLLAYLSTQAQLAGSQSFDIPYNRQELADYLGVDRSALCTVIGQLTHEGRLSTRRSHFELK